MITLTGNASAFGGFLIVTNAAGATIDLSNLTLDDNEDFRIRIGGAQSADRVTIDLSSIVLGDGNELEFHGSSAIETVIASDAVDILRGSSPDTVCYASDGAGVTIDLRSDVSSGGQAKGT